MIESAPSPTALAPLLLRNVLLPLFIYTDKSLLNLTHKFKLLQIIRLTLVTAFLFFLKIIPSFIPSSINPYHNSDFNSDSDSASDYDSTGSLWIPFFKFAGKYNDAVAGDGGLAGDTCIARALMQLLAIVNEIPVSSRKYEIVRSYAEKLMDENLAEGCEPLRRVNATVLSDAFARALGQLKVAAEDDGELVASGGDVVVKSRGLSRVVKTVWSRFVKGRDRLGRLGGSAEKLSAELLWLAQKLAACGSDYEAVRQWASAEKLALAALSAQPRLQGSLVKLSAFLFKQARDMVGEDREEGNTKFKILMAWLPFLCRASIGTEAPILSFTEKAELENVLAELIGSLKHEEEQEKVLSLWLHHFTHCPSSDWPNLHPCYAKWCIVSRKLLILEGK